MHKVLIVEDDPYVVRLYQRLFGFENFEVQLAENGQDGVDKARKYLPDLILMDIMMPVMNGLEALRQIKADNTTHNIKIIMLTNVGEDSIMEIANKFGADDYMVKSNFTPEDVLKKVRSYLGE